MPFPSLQDELATVGNSRVDGLAFGGFSPAFGQPGVDPLSFLNADSRGVFTSGKPSLTLTDAATQLTRSGLMWSTGLGVAANVTFAFRSTAPATMPTDTTGFARFTDIQIAATLLALQAWSDVANITFTRVADADGYSNGAVMLFGDYGAGQSGSAAFAYQPGSRNITSASGDVWVNYDGVNSNTNPALLNYGQHTLTHEIGHAIGLSHPAAYNAAEGVTITYGSDATYYEDSRQYTVMSYFSETFTGGNFRSSISQYSAVPLLDDIAAAQRLYGANLTTRTGNTVYGFNSNAGQAWFSAAATTSVIFAVWDAGGSDTFDFSGYSVAQIIDLRQGAFSNVGGLIGNVSIAAGTVIENAVGGAGSDKIQGNSADNRITGNGGVDVIDGGLGIDTVVFSGARSAYTVTWNGQTGTIIGNGQNATVTNVEFLQFSDQTIAAAPTGGLNVFGDLTNDRMDGTSFGDAFNGGGGNDVINGFGGADNLNGGLGDDILNGGDGDDILNGGLGNDALNGGAGYDIADYSSASVGVAVDLATGRATGGAGVDTLTAIEEIRGSALDDVLTGDSNANILRGGGGVDILNGGGGDDILFAGSPGQSGGAPDVIKTQTTNASQNTPISLDGSFDLLARTDLVSSTTTPHATVVATGGGDLEFYTFTATVGASVTIDIDNASFDSVIRIFDVNGNLVATNDDGATAGDTGNATDSALTFTATAGGVYSVQVSEWVSNDPVTTKGVTAGATYTMHVSVSDHAVVATVETGSTLNGAAGDDTLTGGSGDDRLNGGDGTDTVIYAANSTAFTVSTANGVTTVIGSGFGTDTLTGVERIQFSDRVVLLGATSTDIVGSAANDTIQGTAGNDVIRGLNGDDFLVGGAGSDILDGGNGTDTAGYSGLVRQYTSNSTAIAGGPEGGVDTLVSIERAYFVDGVLSFDANSISAQVMRLYDAGLDRLPDQGGLETQSALVANGTISLQTLANSFVSSAEFQARYGNLSNQAFVEQLYRFSLDRNGDPGGVAAWTANLNNGMSRGQVLVGFSESAEHRSLTASILAQGLWVPDAQATSIARLYDATFDRLPDTAGLIAWTNNLKAGGSLIDIAGIFAGSTEFQQRYGALTNQAFVEQLYRFCLDRSGDPTGIASWTSNLDNGMSRAQVLYYFSESPEHVSLTAPTWYGGIPYFGYQASVPLENVPDKGADGSFSLDIRGHSTTTDVVNHLLADDWPSGHVLFSDGHNVRDDFFMVTLWDDTQHHSLDNGGAMLNSLLDARLEMPPAALPSTGVDMELELLTASHSVLEDALLQASHRGLDWLHIA